MKKSTHFAFILTIIIALGGCGTATTPPATPSATPAVTPMPAPHDPQPGQLLVSYETPLVDKKAARLHNIDLAIAAIDGLTLPPGETFSFNQTVGARTPQRGYKKAIIFVEGKKEKGYGGGICQVSSTLYGAALQFGMEVLERHPHEREVDYAPPGKDATVAYGGFDLKLRNNTTYPIRITCSRTKTTIACSFFRGD